jgi:sugar-specific transcriptional regulator TrmB
MFPYFNELCLLVIIDEKKLYVKLLTLFDNNANIDCMELINSKEKRVLGALYKIGNAPISKIAKETFINRTALYHTVDGLLSKGLVTKINKEGGAYFQPLPLSSYEDWSRRQITSVSSQANELKEWLESQNKQLPTLHSDIRYFEGIEGVENLYSDSWRDNDEKIIYAITDYDKAYDVFNDFMEKEYFPARTRHGVQVKSILSKDAVTGKRDIARSKELLRDMRFVNIFKNLGIEINIYGSKVSIIAFDNIKPSGVIIKNEIIAQAFKSIFEYLWKEAKK